MNKSVFWTVVRALVSIRVKNTMWVKKHNVFVVFWTVVRGFVSIRYKNTMFLQWFGQL